MSKTIENLVKAFIGESQARNRYTFYASAARQEGYEQIAAIFQETADQEKEHAKRLFEHLRSVIKKSGQALPEIKVEAAAPTALGATADNLKAAAAGENHEYSVMYPEFADVAEQEGFKDIAVRMRSIARAEEHHEERYLKLLKEVEAGTVFQKEQEVAWICRECGYKHVGKMAPAKCPSCDHAQAFYQVQCEIY